LPGEVPKYSSIAPGDRLHQGELLTGLLRIRQSLDTVGTQDIRVDEITHPVLVVMTQDCDLAQDFDARTVEAEAAQDPTRLNDPDFKKMLDSAPKLEIENVLLCEAMLTADMKNNVPPGKDIWKRIIQNKDERYQCLEAIPAEQDSQSAGLLSVGCDFKRFLTIPADEVYKRIQANPAVRRSRLLTPYVEHLLHRFCNFQARIPLPENHDVPL
jgi:hypothetical protein